MLKPVTAAACLCAMMAQAQSSTLSGRQLNDLVAGTTVEIDTPLGTKLPVRYGRDGKLSGQARDLASYLGAPFDYGRWWVSSDRLCHKWDRWFNSVPQCLRLSREGRLIRWRSQDGNSGTARISVPATVQAEAVLPRPQSNRPKEIAPPEMPSALADARAKRPAGPATDSDQPSQAVAKRAAKETVVPPLSGKAPPVAAPAAPTEGPPPQPKRAARPMFKVANVRSDDVLNVRSGPSADFDVVGELPPGSRGIAITNACRSKWCPVEHLSATSMWTSARTSCRSRTGPAG